MSYSASSFGRLGGGGDASEPVTPLDSALEGYSPWETIEHDLEQQQQQQQQQQQHPQQQHSQQHPQQSPLIQPPMQTIQLEAQHVLEISGHPSPSTSLGGRTSPSPMGHGGIVDSTPIPLHHPLHDFGSAQAGGRLDMSESEAQMYSIVDSWVSSGSSGSGVTSKPPPPHSQLPASGIRRSARTHPHRSVPYPPSYTQTTTTQQQNVATTSSRRQHTTGIAATAAAGAAGESSSRVDTGKYRETHQQQHFRFVNVRVPAMHARGEGVGSAGHSPVSASGGRAGYGSVVGSPAAASGSRQQSVVPQASPRVPGNALPVPSPSSSSIQQTRITPTPQQQQQQQQQHQQQRRKKYKIRTDGGYQPETGILTLMLELPGVDKRDVRVTLITTRITRVRYLKVFGVVDPVFPQLRVNSDGDGGMGLGEDGVVFRERKFGEFERSFVVPAHLKREDVVVTLKKGILTLNVYLGPPMEVEDVQEIPVN